MASGYHPPWLRGFTHHTIGVSNTESRGITHRVSLEASEKLKIVGAVFSLNLLNNSYLTDSPNVAVSDARGQKRGEIETSKPKDA